MIIESGMSVREVSKDLGINESSLHKWKKDYLSDRQNAFPGKGINDIKTFFETAVHSLSEALKKDGFEIMVGRFITDKIEIIDVCKTNNRGILCSMNDMINHSKYYFSDYKMTPLEISRRLNEMPYSYLKYKNPLDVIKEM